MLVLLLALISAPAHAIEVPKILLEKAKTRGAVRVIVMFQTSYNPTSFSPDPAALKPIQEENARLTKEIAKAAGLDEKSVKGFSITPGFVSEFSAGQLAKVCSDPRVTGVSEDSADHLSGAGRTQVTPR